MFCLPPYFIRKSEKVLVMGILNVTPDSFSDGGLFFDRNRALERAVRMAEEGADIIDVGGESTRPGAEPVSAREEADRICPVIEAVVRETGLPVSADTSKASVAEAAADAGAVIINDISGGIFDPDIFQVAAEKGCGLVLGHTSGRPSVMQQHTEYECILEDICSALSASVRSAEMAGVQENRIILDPGIGFGKTPEDNYRIIKNIGFIKKTGFPVLIGLSRKSLISRLYSSGEDLLPGTLALNTAAVLAGADIIRVHDVRAHVLAMAAVAELMKV